MGMLKNLGASIKRRAGLDVDEEALAHANWEAKIKEKERLEAIARKKKGEARFFDIEGQGKRRFAKLSLGNEEDLDAVGEDRRSLRASGRFTDDRLVL